MGPLAKISGMIESFSLAIGNVCRFHTRVMMPQIAKVAQVGLIWKVVRHAE